MREVRHAVAARTEVDRLLAHGTPVRTPVPMSACDGFGGHLFASCAVDRVFQICYL
jgi:hypothetical protein